MFPNLTLSQTYIDIGALKFAFDAYRNFISEKGEEGSLPGAYLNNEQLFFTSFAQVFVNSLKILHNFLLVCSQCVNQFDLRSQWHYQSIGRLFPMSSEFLQFYVNPKDFHKYLVVESLLK